MLVTAFSPFPTMFSKGFLYRVILKGFYIGSLKVVIVCKELTKNVLITSSREMTGLYGTPVWVFLHHFAKPHNFGQSPCGSFGNKQDLRTGGHWFDTWLNQYSR